MTHAENLEVALNSLLLRSLPAEVTDKVLSGATSRRYERGETIFLQGEEARAIHIVIDGWIKLYRIAQNGNEAVVNVFTRGHSFGEAVAFRQGNYPVSAEAVSDCTLLAVSASGFVSIMKREPDICLAVLASTFQHLHELVSQVEQIKAQTGAQRVAEFLLNLCQGDAGGCVVTLPYDKVLIAGHLGMKPESLSRAFSKLKQAGVRVARNHATIDDVATLRAFAKQDPAGAWSKAL